MHHIMAKFWWILAARGILGILLGLGSILWMLLLGETYRGAFSLSIFGQWAMIVATLILVLGLYAFIDGLFAVLLGAQDYGEGRRWWSLILEGVLSIGLGILAWLKPESMVLMVLYWVAGWAVLTGFLEILQGFDLNEYKDRRRPMFFAGLCSVVFGLLILVFRVGGIALVWVMGAYAFAFGIPMLILAFQLRHYAQSKAYKH